MDHGIVFSTDVSLMTMLIMKIFFVFPYPHFRVKDNAKGKKVNRVMYAIGHIPGLGKMIVGKGGLARMKGGIEEED